MDSDRGSGGSEIASPRADGLTRGARINFTLIFLFAFAMAAYVTWPFRVPLFLALALASALHGVYAFVVRRVRGHRSIAALITTLGMLVVIIGPMAAIVGFVAGQLIKGLLFVRAQLGINSVDELQSGMLSARGEALIDRTLAAFHLSRAQVEGVARDAATWAEHLLQQLLRGSSEAVFHTAIMLIAFYFFLIEGDRLLTWLERISPLAERQTHDLLAEFRAVSRASIVGTAVAALFQGIAATVGFLLVGMSNAVFFGVLTLFASFIPVIGTVLIWGPAVALLWTSGHHISAIVLLVWSMVFIVGAEHIGKPFVLRAVLRGGEEMHTGLVFLSLLGGIEMFGLIGLVLGPLAIAFFLAMVRIYERDFRAPRVVLKD